MAVPPTCSGNDRVRRRAIVRCAQCSTANPDQAKFCQKCGSSLSVVCLQCGATLLPHASFCTECGTEVSAPDALVSSMPPDKAAQRLHRLVPREFAERLLATRGQVARERRIVTILFSDVKGSTAMAEHLDPEEWMEIMDGAFELLIEPVYRYEGTVARLMGDAILAFFGAPIAHENDPERACRAALEIVEGARQYAARLERERMISGFNVRVGINTGLVVVGEVGSDLRVEYTAMGDAINLAARMESAARPGTVLITEATHRLIAPLFETEALGPLEVKGKAAPVHTYRLQGPRVQPERVRGLESRGISSPLVGRDTELQVISNCIDRLLNGQGSILSIIGEAGVGKSRLMAEIHQNAAAAPLQWLEGRTLSFGQTISYWPFQEILWQYAAISEDDSEATAWHKLESQVSALFAEQTAETLPYLASLLSMEVRDDYVERVKYLDGEAMGHQVFLASRRFFERLAQARPLVLVFEDLHWVDESSALLLEHLFPLVERVPLLICGVGRPYRRTPAARLQGIAAQAYTGRYTEIQLAPLSQTDSAQLVRNLLEIQDLPPRVQGRILRKAEGNPFYLEEIIRTLIDAGAVRHDPTTNHWQVTAQVETLTIPDTIQGVIMARVDRLDEEVKQVLRTAAVVGRSFLYRLLRAVAEADRQLDHHLAELQAIELIREKQRLPELEYIFKHALAQEATYESILLQRRRELHARVGRAIEALFADRLEEFYSLLAHHYAQAEAWEKAQEYLLKAGDQAGRVAADAEALTHYEQAMAAYAQAFGDDWDPLQRATLERKIGEALLRRGEHEPALDHLRRALACLGKPLPASAWGVRLAILCELAVQIAHRLLPGFFVKPVARPVGPVAEEEVRTYESAAWIESTRNAERFMLMSLRGLNLSERVGFSEGIATASVGLGYMLDFIPIFELAEGYHRRAVALVCQSQNPGMARDAYHGMAWHEAFQGRLDAAIGFAQQAVEAFWATGDLHRWGFASYQLALALAYQGGLLRALAYCRDLVRFGQEGAYRRVQCWGLCGQGFIQQRLGQSDEAVAALKQALQLAEAIPDQAFCISASADLGRCYLGQGNLDQALAALNTSLAFYTLYLGGDSYASLRNGLADAYLSAAEQCRQAEKADWLKKARRACKDARKQGKAFRPGLPEAMRLQGTYEFLRGKPSAAQKRWQRSLSLAEEMEQRYDVGMTHLEMGRRLGERTHLECAATILAEIGAEPGACRAREALGEASVI